MWKQNCGQTSGSSCRAERSPLFSLFLAVHHCLVYEKKVRFIIKPIKLVKVTLKYEGREEPQ